MELHQLEERVAALEAGLKRNGTHDKTDRRILLAILGFLGALFIYHLLDTNNHENGEHRANRIRVIIREELHKIEIPPPEVKQALARIGRQLEEHEKRIDLLEKK